VTVRLMWAYNDQTGWSCSLQMYISAHDSAASTSGMIPR
jgi:hypothetical protein